MPRPTSKKQLLECMEKEHDKLEALLRGVPAAQLGIISRTTEWSVLDVLGHLSDWEQMCLAWWKVGISGKVPPVPAEGYNWAQLPSLNVHLRTATRKRSPAAVLRRFTASYRTIRKTIEGIRERDLFEPGRFAWTGKNALAAYFISATSSHYAWAQKDVKKCLK
jgi:hypothetical protein